LNKAILHKSIDLLSRREHSEQELQNKLLQREFELAEIASVLTYLSEKGYLSDERFTESIYRLRVNKGYGERYIQNELSQKGVSRSIISLIAENQEIDWYHLAKNTYLKRFGEREIVDQRDKAKRIRFMQYRGFSTDQIMSVVID